MLIGLHDTPIHEHFIHDEVRLRAELMYKPRLPEQQTLHWQISSMVSSTQPSRTAELRSRHQGARKIHMYVMALKQEPGNNRGGVVVGKGGTISRLNIRSSSQTLLK